MKKIILSLLSVFLVMSMSAQVFKKDDKVLNVGIGLGSTLYSGSGYKTTVPPLSASFEYGIIDNLFDENSSIGVGGYFGYTASKYEWNYGYNLGKYEYKYSSAIIAARGTFHYQFVDNLDTYTGLSLGYNVVSSKSDHKDLGSYKADASSVFVGWYAGARYYFNESFAAMAEVGYDVAYLNIGIAYKF